MKLTIFKPDGNKSSSSITVDKNVFAIEPNEAAVHQAVIAELANFRQGTSSSKNRSMVRGGGRKPFRQKGRGGARAGTIRSPLWVGGGTVFGPEPRTYSHKLPKKLRRLARKSVLSDKASKKGIMVVEDFKLESPKTRDMVKMLSDLNISGKKVLILPEEISENLVLATNNIPGVYVVKADFASTYDLIDCDILLFTESGLKLLNKSLGDKAS
ncbi:MAG: 50S ribosomal protein L4 [Candidatus Marinimicrobia bacterium]|jgi:large subunit ribosomal protein L4|nr:50S ribosomal protein L4 [Candidatus Neomarinimicrobiota bacterium]MDP6790226.1 50S ribosomal protein L4 [Candidatus Neomarinimicrobiota bacterium]MDP7072341.1 50S ribosomal protein L4 [Candidatus Neomarinimicrobiota bacterium]